MSDPLNGGIFLPSYGHAKKAAETLGSSVNWIGGRSCLEFALPFVDEICLTRVHTEVQGDVTFELHPENHGFERVFWETRASSGLSFTLEIWKSLTYPASLG